MLLGGKKGKDGGFEERLARLEAALVVLADASGRFVGVVEGQEASVKDLLALLKAHNETQKALMEAVSTHTEQEKVLVEAVRGMQKALAALAARGDDPAVRALTQELATELTEARNDGAAVKRLAGVLRSKEGGR